MLTTQKPPNSAPFDWRTLDLPEPLKNAAASVEFTCCALVPRRRGALAINVLTTAVVRPRTPSKPWRYKTPKLIEIIAGELSFGILEGEVASDRGMTALGFTREFVLPDDGAARLHAPGEWTPPRLWGRSDHARPNWLPYSHDPLWTVERIPSAWPEGIDLPEQGWERISAAMRENLGVDVPREHWGGIVVVVPDARVWTVAEAAQGPRLGITILPRTRCVPAKFVVATKTWRRGTLEFSRTHLLPPGHHVVPFPAMFEKMDVEISDASSGYPVDRHSGPVFRELNFSIDVCAEQPIELVADFVDPPRTVQLKFADRQRSVVGQRASWELSRARESRRRRIEGLRASGQVAFYLGSLGTNRDEDRRRAVLDVQEIIRGAQTKVWIWDKYFGVEDILDYLTAVTDRKTQVRVLSSTEAAGKRHPSTNSKRACGDSSDNPLARLKEAVAWLRHPPGVRSGGLSALELRLGPRVPAHDRFLLTDDRCLILGCSLNQLGNVCSSMVEFPDRDAVEAAFIRAWDTAKNIELVQAR